MTIPKRNKRRKKGEQKWKELEAPPFHKAIFEKRGNKSWNNLEPLGGK